jgi:hypothetical protein
MAFKLKTGKTLNKFLAGMGVATGIGLIASAVAPNMAGSGILKAAEGIAAYGVGGIESAAGAVIPMLAGSSLTAFTGSNSEGNVQVESL